VVCCGAVLKAMRIPSTLRARARSGDGRRPAHRQSVGVVPVAGGLGALPEALLASTL
jgi:hypothetical protein